MSFNSKLSKCAVFVAAVLVSMGALGVAGSKKSVSNNNTIVLSKDNLVVLDKVVDGESVGAVIRKVKELDAAQNTLMAKIKHGSHKPLYLYLNTPGGSIQSGLELIEAINGVGRPVHTITAFAASMGFQIAQNLGDRLILKNGVLMSHRARGGFEGSFGGAYPSQLDSRYHMWLQRLTELGQQTVKRTNGKQTLESYQKQYAEEMWITGSEAVEQGYADKMVTVKCDETLIGTSAHEVTFMGFQISYELDNCPINTAPMNIKVNVPENVPADLKNTIRSQFLQQYEIKMNKPVDLYI